MPTKFWNISPLIQPSVHEICLLHVVRPMEARFGGPDAATPLRHNAEGVRRTGGLADPLRGAGTRPSCGDGRSGSSGPRPFGRSDWQRRGRIRYLSRSEGIITSPVVTVKAGGREAFAGFGS